MASGLSPWLIRAISSWCGAEQLTFIQAFFNDGWTGPGKHACARMTLGKEGVEFGAALLDNKVLRHFRS